MPAKAWWTVSATYDDTGESYVEHFEAKTCEGAWKKALHKADAVIRLAGIFEGKIYAVNLHEVQSVVPIRGKTHAIEVANVRITTRKFIIPGRCPGCRKDLRRANALTETYLAAYQWKAHLSHNEKDLSSERDGFTGRVPGQVIDAARLVCSACDALIWDGFHVG